MESLPQIPSTIEPDLEKHVHRFECACRSELQPRLEDYLPRSIGAGAESDRLKVLLELIKLELEYCWRRPEWGMSSARQPVIVEGYLRQYPELATVKGAFVKLIVEEYRVRQRWGDKPSQQEYFVRFPQHADYLANALPRTDAELAAEFAPKPEARNVADQTTLPPVDKRLTNDIPQWALTVEQHPAHAKEPRLPRIPGYDILSVLGRGGMGVVYRARQHGLNRIVAIKMILAGSHAGPQDLTRFRTEAEAVARLKHPNIVQIHEIGEHEGLPYFSLEFCEGGSLSQQLAGTPLPPREAAKLVETLAKAMDGAHRAGIIHRDLKPGNVLLSIDSGIEITTGSRPDPSHFATSIPKITDFGLAKKLESAGHSSEAAAPTATGAVIGTPSYMAPEQAEGKSDKIGPAVDIYALGAILYECLTGRPPFRAATALDTIIQVISEDAVPPRRLNAKVPRDLETICLKCLHKDVGRRYQDSRQLAEDLRRFQCSEPICARPVGATERSWKWVRRHPAVAALIGFLMLSGVMAATLALWALCERDEAIAARKKANASLKKANAATVRAEAEKSKAEEERQKTRRQFALSLYDQALFHCEQEGAARGLLWLARSLQEASRADAPDIMQSIRKQLGAWKRDLHLLREVLDHQKAVTAVAFSANGKTMLTGCADRKVRLWDSTTGKLVGPVLQHQGPVLSVAYSPDGKTILTGGSDNTARLWDTATGKPLDPPLQHQGAVNSVCFSPDGKTVLTGADDCAARLWHAGTGQLLGSALQHQAPVCFSPDGQTVLTGSDDKAAQMWDASTCQPSGSPLRHRAGVRAVAYSPDGKTVLTGSWDYTARLWHASTGQPIGSPMQHQNWVLAVAFSPDGRTVLTASHDRTARIWEAATGRLVGPSLEHQYAVLAVAFSPDGKTLLTGNEDGLARVWQVAIGEPISLHHDGPISVVVFSPDGKTALTGSHDKTAQLWQVSTGQPIGHSLQHDGPILAAAISPDGKTVLTGSADTKAQLWHARTGRPTGPPLQHQGPIRSVAFSPNSKTLLTASDDTTAQLWHAETGRALGQPLQHDGSVLAGTFSPSGRIIATGSDAKSARLWTLATAQPFERPLLHLAGVRTVAFSPDSKTVLTGSSDGTARLWRAATCQPIGPPLQHQGLVKVVAFSPDGKTVLTGSWDNTARLWNATTGQSLGPPLEHQGAVEAAAFSPDSQTVLTGSGDKTARLWHAPTGKALGPPLQHRNWVWAVAFDPGGQTVLTGSADMTARLWKMPSPVLGRTDRIMIWTQVHTGLELDHFGSVRVLDFDTWQLRRKQLAMHGGPPD